MGAPKGIGIKQWEVPTKCTYGIKYPSMKSATAAVYTQNALFCHIERSKNGAG